MVAVEAKPYATAGGASDVVGALSRELRENGHDVRLVLPYYDAIIRAPRYRLERLADLDVPVGSKPVRASVCKTNESTYLVGGDADGYFAKVGRGDAHVYPTLEDRSVDAAIQGIRDADALPSPQRNILLCEDGQDLVVYKHPLSHPRKG